MQFFFTLCEKAVVSLHYDNDSVFDRHLKNVNSNICIVVSEYVYYCNLLLLILFCIRTILQSILC